MPTELRIPRSAAAPVILAAVGTAAYFTSFSGAWVLDDGPSILANPTIRSLRHPGMLLSPPEGGLTVSGRPVLNLSFALNYAMSGADPWSYHVVNLAVHVGAACLLFGLVRRLSCHENGERLAGAAALLWLVHQLMTESVTYVSQRAESLMGLFYLGTLYGVVRCAQECGRERRVRSGIWGAFAVLCCFLGMGTKEVMASAPLAALVLDRTFFSASFTSAIKRRGPLYPLLGLSWVFLAECAVQAGSRGGTVGFDVGVPVLAYWAAQLAALATYLKLAVWPHPLVFDYGTPRTWPSAAVASGAVLLAAIAFVAVWGIARKRFVGLLAFVFLAALAPTSLIPGNRQFLAEHRMYLPCACVMVGLAALLFRVAGRATPAVSAAIALGLSCATFARNQDYRSRLALYEDTAAKRPDNPHAQVNLGLELFRAGRIDESVARYRAAILADPLLPEAHANLGNALLEEGRASEAVGPMREAVRLGPLRADFHANLGAAYYLSGRKDLALGECEEAVRLDPRSEEAHNNLGNVLAASGRFEEAAAHYRKALAIDPDYLLARENLARITKRLTEATGP